MIFKDYYRILELDGPKCTFDEIKAAYREQAKKYHPDVNVGNKTSEERFKDINEAYRVLSETSAKRKYDRMWNSNIGKKKEKFEESKRSKDSIFSDFFNIFFGNSQPKETSKTNKKVPIKGENIDTEVEISLEEAFYGLDKKISLRTVKGKMKTFSVKIPAGIRNEEKIRLIGQGKEGSDGGRNGDLFIKIKIKDTKRFKLDGFDLYTELLLTPWEAALGAKREIDSIDGKVNVRIPHGTCSGEFLRIAEKGYKDGKGGRGDLIAEVRILVPKDLTDDEKKLFKQLKEKSEFKAVK